MTSERLTGQLTDQSGHCPFAGHYFEPENCGRMLCNRPFASRVIHMVQNHHAEEEGTHWEKFCLSCPGASIAPKHV